MYNLPLFIGQSDEQDAAIAAAMNGSASLEESLSRLSGYFRIRITFTEPVQIMRKITNKHTFLCFFLTKEKRICYGNKRNAHSGRYFHHMNKIKDIEFISEHFDSYEQFKRKFDPRFIKEERIKQLWEEGSPQHGGKYLKSDFRPLGKSGRELMKRFLKQFTTVGEKTSYYHRAPKYEPVNRNTSPLKDQGYDVLAHYHYTNSTSRQAGRDLTISASTQAPCVWYSSEYPGCGNGDYGIIATKSNYLYIEKD